MDSNGKGNSNRMSLDLSGKLPDFGAIAKHFPNIERRFLGHIGKAAAIRLYYEHLRGQDLNVESRGRTSRGLPAGKSGRPLVNYTVRGHYVEIKSFPLNLFEEERVWTRGKFADHVNSRGKHIQARRESGRGILLRKFQPSLSSRLQNLLNNAEKVILKDALEEAGGIQ